ncbi:hypothetical protein CAEBREN_05258 [Caenorhabditis brenneri]|uniref:RNase H type-1 domain-containing protein n=1 Tax=Caenorhabditis brenneri TaxID=135651 RepID=G0PGA3_CAEBE|nr:hypothetical protein CAEBREN_05258 [Caenorhabditis brenneri]
MPRFSRPNRLQIYTDGCALGNGQPGAQGGWAIVFKSNYFNNDWGYSTVGPQTNNRYELEAIQQAIRTSLRGGGVYDITIYTDSKYALDALTIWIHNWKNNGWRTCRGNEVQNSGLFQMIDSMIRNMNNRGGSVQFRYVEAHSGNRWNDEADRLAKFAASQNPIWEESDDEDYY